MTRRGWVWGAAGTTSPGDEPFFDWGSQGSCGASFYDVTKIAEDVDAATVADRCPTHHFEMGICFLSPETMENHSSGLLCNQFIHSTGQLFVQLQIESLFH